MIKQKTFRSRKYLAWVRSLDCCRCQAPADHAHHLIGVGNMGGMGTKAPDDACMPVCAGCHREIHETPDLWPHQWEWLSRTLLKARQEGVL